jgi:hypothetical protein
MDDTVILLSLGNFSKTARLLAACLPDNAEQSRIVILQYFSQPEAAETSGQRKNGCSSHV